MSRYAEKNHVSNPYPHDVSSSTKICFFSARHCMKCVGLHRRIMFLTQPVFGSEVGAQGVNLHKQLIF